MAGEPRGHEQERAGGRAGHVQFCWGATLPESCTYRNAGPRTLSAALGKFAQGEESPTEHKPGTVPRLTIQMQMGLSEPPAGCAHVTEK